jgi:hypothetical protein
MDLSTLPLVGPLLHGGADLVAALTAALSPVAGSFAAAIAVVLLTLAVRLVLVPLSVLQVRADEGQGGQVHDGSDRWWVSGVRERPGHRSVVRPGSRPPVPVSGPVRRRRGGSIRSG